MCAGVGGEHLPDDGELIGACEDIGEDEGEPELAHILLCLAEKEQVAGVGDRVDEQRDDENGEEADFGRFSRAGVETEERIV